jgi:anti-sigma regulatory factor (Ser/Thr protein kinase)
MKIETTRSSTAVRLEHAAGFHSSDADLLAQLVPLAQACLDRGERLAVALRPATAEALRERLDGSAGSRAKSGDAFVLLSDPEIPDGPSGQTVAARRALELRALTATDGPVTVLTEHSSRLDGVDGGFWTEFDAAVNVALADLPVRVTCFFPELPLHLEILAGARRNHPLLLVDGQLQHNPEHRAPRDVLAERPAPAPVLLGPPDIHLQFSAWQLHEVRRAVERALGVADFEPERAEDVVLAVNELATNAVEHGSPEAQLSLWSGPDGLVCEIDDSGSLRDPLPGLQAPHPAEPRGRGVWIARQLCDALHVWVDGHGTHVRLRATP